MTIGLFEKEEESPHISRILNIRVFIPSLNEYAAFGLETVKSQQIPVTSLANEMSSSS